MSSGTNERKSPLRSETRSDGSSNVMIMATADDAILAKLSTSSRGYYTDPFLPHMAKNAAGVSVTSKQNDSQHQPIIRRGTYARVCCMDRAISCFLNSVDDVPLSSSAEGPDTGGKSFPSRERQVVVLGAGKDTSYLRYRSGLLTAPARHRKGDSVRWYEVDLCAVMAQKRHLLNSCPFGMNPTSPPSGLSHFMVGHDLRSFPEGLFEKLCGLYSFNVEVPTLFVSECVFMYLPEVSTRLLLATIRKTCKVPLVGLFDPIFGPEDDPFGRVMQRNLTNAGVMDESSNMNRNRTLGDQIEMFRRCQFDVVSGCDMWTAFDKLLTEEQRRRANRCEMLDEVEEWMLIMRHYCFVIAGRGDFARGICRSLNLVSNK